jgi:hypothetical protein
MLFAHLPLLCRLLESVILHAHALVHLLGLLKPLILLLQPSYLSLHPLLSSLHLAVPPVNLFFQLCNQLLLPIHLILDLRQVFLRGWLPIGAGCGLETGHDSYTCVAQMTLLDGLGNLDAMDLDSEFACLLLLFLDNEELVS